MSKLLLVTSIVLYNCEISANKPDSNEKKDSYYTPPTTHQYKSLKNLSAGHYTPSVEHNPSMSVYTPSPMQSTSTVQNPAMTSSVSYSRHLNGASNDTGNVNTNNATNGAPDTSTFAVRNSNGYNTGTMGNGIDASAFAPRQSSNAPPPAKNGGHDAEGLYPSPTHAVRNQFGNNRSMTNSSYDLRADKPAENYNPPTNYANHDASLSPEKPSARPYNPPTNYANHDVSLSPEKSAARPFTAAPEVL